MQIKSKLIGCLVTAALLSAISYTAKAQSSSINTYSPYTLYGIGDLALQGPVSLKSMGGIGAAYRSATKINSLNPASYSAIPRKSALFSVAVEGQNFYLREGDKRTSYNAFNISDISLQLPVYKGIGFAFSMTPYSRVGYQITNRISNGSIGSEIGSAEYNFEGSGGITQFKAGIGWAITDYISIGADLIYYHGKISRDFSAIFTPYTNTQNVTNLYGYKTHKINTAMGLFGLQARLFKTDKNMLMFGATYRMGGTLKGSVTKEVPTSLLTSDGGDAIYIDNDSVFKLADTYTAGFMFENRERLLVGLDYSYARWSVNAEEVANNVKYRDTHSINFGLEFTPNARDIRHYVKRISYRLGARYSQYYINYNGTDINECAVSVGLGFPLNAARSQYIDFGVEYGVRGKNSNGLIKEQFIKFTIGFSMFGGDYWFSRPKYN